MYDQPPTREQLPQTTQGADVTARWSVPLEPAVTQTAPQQAQQVQQAMQPPVQQVPQQSVQQVPQHSIQQVPQQTVQRGLKQVQQPTAQSLQQPRPPQQAAPGVQQPQQRAQQSAQQSPQTAQQATQPAQQPTQSIQQSAQPAQQAPQPIQQSTQPVQQAAPAAQQLTQQAGAAQVSMGTAQTPQLTSQPSVDLVETPETLSILVDLPGCEKREIELEGDERTLTISAKRPVETNDGRFFYHERPEAVERTIELPADVEVEDAEATYENGILTVTLPKSDDSRSKRIGIQ